MATAQSITTAIVLRARDETEAAFDRVRRNVNRLEQNLESGRRTGTGTAAAFGSVARNIAALAVGALGLTAIIGNLKSAMEATGTSSAQAEFIVKSIGPTAEKALKEVEGSFSRLAREFDTTESAVRNVFAIILRESYGAAFGVKDLEGAMALARANSIGFADAAMVVGMALRGEMGPLEKLTGPQGITTLAKAYQNAKVAAGEASTWFTRSGSEIKRIFEDLGGGKIEKLIIPENLREGPSLWNNFWSAVTGGPDTAELSETSRRIQESLGKEVVGGVQIATLGQNRLMRQAIVNLNFQGNVVMNEDQQRSIVREMRRVLDEESRRGGP